MKTQHDTNDPVNSALDQLSSREFKNTNSLDKLEGTLVDQFHSPRKPLFNGPYRLAFLIVCMLVIGGGGIAATTTIISQFKLYNIEVKVDDDKIIDASILVAEREAATMIITDDDGEVRRIEIDEDGNITYTGGGEAEIDVTVQDVQTVEEPPDVKMVMLEFMITLNDVLISNPKILLNAGDTGSLEIGSQDGDGNDVKISITTDSEGNFEIKGLSGIEATVKVTRIHSNE